MERMTLKLAEDSHLGREGTVVELSLTPTDVRIQEEIPTYLAGYKEFGYRADEVSPVIPVDKDTDQFRNFSQSNTFQPVKVKGSIEGVVPEVDPRTAMSSYKVVDRFAGSFINDRTAMNVSGRYQPRQAAARRIQRVLQIDREVDVFALVAIIGSWATSVRVSLGAGFQWGGPSGMGAASDPIKDLHDRMEASAQAITGWYLNRTVANALLRHPSTRDYVRAMVGDSVPDMTLRAVNASPQGQSVDFTLPGLPPFHVCEAKWEDPADNVLKYIMPNVVLGMSLPPGIPADGETICTSKTFRLNQASGVGYGVREYRVENRGPMGGTMLVGWMADQAVITANNCGGFIGGVLQ